MTGSPSSADTEALETHLERVLDAPVTGIRTLADGLNLVLGVETADGDHADEDSAGGDHAAADRDSGEPAYVVRRPNLFRETASFNSLKREYRLLEALSDTGVDAPVPVRYCADESILDGPFYVATHRPGETVPLGSDLPERFRTPAARRAIAAETVDALAGIHSVSVDRIADGLDRRGPLEQVEDAADRLDRATSVTGRNAATLRSVIDWLREHPPSNPATALVHGDFRPGNLLYAGETRPRVSGVLDWETAMLGDPLTDLGYLLLRWRDAGDPTPSVDELAERYPGSGAIEELRARNADGMAPFTAKAGSPTRREIVERYEAATGIDVDHVRFYRAHGAVMLAVVWEDFHRLRVEAGEHSEWPPHVDYVATLAELIVDGEFEL